MINTALPTKFAPAERASALEMENACTMISNLPLLRETLDTMPVMVLLLNQQRQIVFANRLIANHFDLKAPAEALGLRLGELIECVHSDEEPGGCGTTESCSTCGGIDAILSAQKGLKTIREVRIITKRAGQCLDLRVWAEPYPLRDGDFTMTVMMDISHEKRRRVLEHLFFHDVSNTLGALIPLAELMKDAPSDKLTELSPLVLDLSYRLFSEIKAHRQLTDAENGELGISLSEVRPADLIQELASSFKDQDVADGRSIKIDDRSQNMVLTTDRTLLSRVLTNMIKNALEATPPGGVATLACRPAGDKAEFSVHNATTMPRNTQLQVFQRSFSSKGEGRGIGTYSMKLLTEGYLHGEISFLSNEECGTTFTVRYPLKWSNKFFQQKK